MSKYAWLIGFLVVSAAVLYLAFFAASSTPEKSIALNPEEQELSRFGLKTDTSKKSIDLDDILSGGPGKDGIPALDDPKFVSVEDAEVEDQTLGVLVIVGREKRFYPYNILVWHEIINDSIGNTHFAVTFCPLCGSAIVFDREVEGEVLTFGVSGLLYESNLLMYDRETESLWSQAAREAVVGTYTGQELGIIDMRLIPFESLKEAHPDAQVLSRDTGYSRSYDVDPYTGYGLVDDLYFPVSVSDTRLPPKTIVYVVPIGEQSIAFQDQALTGESRFTVEDAEVVARRLDDGIEVRAGENVLPGYYEMWFSWATHHQDNGVLIEL